MPEKGNRVIVEYAGYLDDGTVFESTAGSEPFEFTLGDGQVMDAFEKAVLKMEVGETRTVTIPAAEAYGPYREDRIIELSRKACPAGLQLRVGLQLQIETSDGSPVAATILEITENSLKVDANSSLAGKDLTFDIRLLKIKE
jgi:peptidylprolyl isomerase